jgi:hypothetical protein
MVVIEKLALLSAILIEADTGAPYVVNKTLSPRSIFQISTNMKNACISLSASGRNGGTPVEVSSFG